MDLEVLRYEVQRIDGTPQSVFRAIDLLISELMQPNFDYLPKSIEYGFFEEFYKCLANWMGRGESEPLREIMNGLNIRIKSDESFLSPFAGSSSKKRFGSYLTFVNEMIEVYLRSDLELKDLLSIMGHKENHRRYRTLLAELFTSNISQFTVADIARLGIYSGLHPKTAERDLTELVNGDFISQNKVSPKKIFYQLTSRAWYHRVKILDRIAEDEVVPVPVWREPPAVPDPVPGLAPRPISAYGRIAHSGFGLLAVAEADQGAYAGPPDHRVSPQYLPIPTAAQLPNVAQEQPGAYKANRVLYTMLDQSNHLQSKTAAPTAVQPPQHTEPIPA